MTPRPKMSRRLFVAGAALLGSPLHAPLPAGAQGTPVSSSHAALGAAVMLERLPGKRVNAFFARHAFAPGAEAPTFDRLGSALVLAESGSLTLTSDGPVGLRRSGEVGPIAMTEVPPEGIQLDTGDAALIEHGRRMGLGNASDAPATLFMLIAYAPYHQFSYVHPTALPDATGVTTTFIGLGQGAFEEVPAVMLIERDVVRPGGSDYSTTYGGIEIGAVAAGSARARLMNGTGWTTRRALNASRPPIAEGDTPLQIGAEVDLDPADGYVSHGGSLLWRATGEGPLVVVRAQLVPVPKPAD